MRRSAFLVFALTVALTVPALAVAQDTSVVSDQQTVRISPADRAKTLKTVQDELDHVTIEFRAAMSGALGPVVPGAPYSAITTTEKVQNLADGNRIATKTTYNVFRDGQGRVRREEVADNGAVTLVIIMDPVTNTSYVLDPIARAGQKLTLQRQNFVFSTNREERDAAIASSAEVIAGKVRTEIAVTKGFADGGATIVSVEPAGYRREPMGTQVMEGVSVEGTRTVSSIPAGQIGNERQIDTVTEQWYSKDLKMTIMSRHSDPRNGETIFRVTNLRRDEPDPTLFQVPGDYTIKEPMKEIVPKVVK